MSTPRTRLKNHFKTEGWKYLLLCALMFIFCFSSIQLVTNNIPAQDIVRIRLVGDVRMTNTTHQLQQQLQQSLVADGLVRQAKIESLYYKPVAVRSGDDILPGEGDLNAFLLDPNNQGVGMSLQGVISNYADVFILHQDLFYHYQGLGLFEPLDAAFADGSLPESLRDYAITAQIDGQECVIGLDAGRLNRLRRTDVLNTQYHVVALPYNCANKPAALASIAWLYANALI